MKLVIEKTYAEGSYNRDICYDHVNTEQGELTVTITLAEYRDLLRTKFDCEQKKEKLSWLEQYQRANNAEARVKELEQKISVLMSLCPAKSADESET